MSEIAAHKSILPRDINEEMKSAYLDYAMSVIVSRALPDIRDGLKPVHRRVIYAMYEQKIFHNKSYKKSARVVGDVLGKYHPHGDTAVYDAVVRLAQDFSMRYMLVDGQGNFGSIDGDSPAAMRYTEVRLGKISSQLVTDIEEETVDFAANYDNSESEPTVLPTQIPLLLVNGQQGIAVGMATNIPPHNLSEIIDAILHLIDNKSVTIEELCQFVKGPDFPTHGIIRGTKGIRDAYRTGRGSVVVRARCEVEEVKGGRERILITELPYQVNKATLIEKIADLVKEGDITGISDIRDESNKEGIRVVIELKKGENGEIILNHLYKRTRLQDSFGINMVCIVRGVPKLVNLKDCLEAFRDHRYEVVTRRTAFRLKKAEARAHILEGLKIAVENVDEVVAIIRGSQNTEQAAYRLTERFGLSEKQVKAILDMRLARLTALERDKIVEEYSAILELIADLKDILAKPERVVAIVREELLFMKEEYGDERRTEITTESGDVNIEELVAPEDVFITFSSAGYIKRVPVESFRSQARSGKGKTGAGLKDADFIKFSIRAHSHDHLLMFSNHGKAYCLRAFEIPEASATAKGRVIAHVLTLSAGEKISTILPVREFTETDFAFFTTSQGTVKKVALSAFKKIRESGLRCITLEENDKVVNVRVTNGEQEMILVTENGRACRFSEDSVRAMGRSARGVGGIRLDDGDSVVAAEIVHNHKKILAVTEKGYGKRSSPEEYRLTTRNKKGVGVLKITERNGKVASVLSVSDGDDIMLTTNTGRVLRTNVEEIRVAGRMTQGVCLMKVLQGEKIVSVTQPNEVEAIALAESAEESEK